jgi:predicted nuclease with TOPRIM domain
MFGWMNILKGLAVAAVLLAVGGTIYAGYRYVDNLRDENARLVTENATLIANNAQLEVAISEQQKTIETLQEDFSRQAAILNNTYRRFQDARDQVDALRDRLSDHELGYLATQRPGLVENVINNASDAIGRCFEIASGSPLTEEELNATLPSQINRECPELANPNYRGER